MYFNFTPAFFKWIFLSKEINRLIRNANNYLNSYIEKY